MNPNKDITIPKKEIAPGVFSTGGTATMPTVNPINNQPNVITPQSLVPQASVPLPQTQLPTQPTPVANLTAGLLSQYDLNQKETQAKGFQDTGMEQYLKDIIGLQGETQAKAEELGKTDFAKNRAELVGVENRFRQLEAEKAQDDVTLVSNMRDEERRDTLLPFAQMGQAKLAGDAQIVRALKTSEQNMLNSRSLALQGNMDLAKQTAEDAVAIKYAPYKDRIKSYEDIVKALEPYLTSAEKKESAKQLMKGNLVMKEIEKIEANEKAIEKMLLDATPNAPAEVILSAKAIKDKGGSALEVAQALGKYGGDYLKTEMLKEQIKTEKAQQENIYNTISARNADTIRQDNAAKGINNGTLKQEDIAKAIESKAGVKTIATKGLVTELENLKSLYEKYGARPTTAEGIGAIQSARSSAQLAITAAFGQGAISEGDRSSYTKLTGTNFGISPTANLNQAIQTQKKNYETNLGILNTAYPGVDKLEAFGGATTTTQNPADNKFGQAIGIQAPVDYTTTNMSVAPDGALVWKLPTNPTTK